MAAHSNSNNHRIRVTSWSMLNSLDPDTPITCNPYDVSIDPNLYFLSNSWAALVESMYGLNCLNIQ